MWISFEHPGWIFLLLLLLPTWWLALHAPEWIISTRAIVTACIRSLVIVLLTAALSQPSIVESNDGITVVIVADASRSVPSAMRSEAQKWLQQRMQERSSSKDRLAVVTFAKNAEIHGKPSSETNVKLMSHSDDGIGSDLSAGIRMAMALMPRETRKRIVLLSDGNETSGNVVEAAQFAHAAGVAIDVVPLEVAMVNDTMMESMRVPARARRGQIVDAKIVLRAQKPVDGRIRFQIDGEALDLDSKSAGTALAVRLQSGPNVISIPVALPKSGVMRMSAIFEPLDANQDAVAENNIASAITFVSGEGRVLIVDDSGNESKEFAQALRASQLDVQVSNASVLRDPTVAGSFDAIVLANIARWSLDQQSDQAIESAVHDFGVGLFMLGGDHSFGAGGWSDSQTAKALPVEMNPPQERQLPKGALAIIIDCSGSMSSPVGGSNLDQQQCANEAAIQGMRSLTESDQITVIAFSDSSRVIVPLMNVQNPDAIAKQIRRITPTGGTNLFPALKLADEQFTKSNRAVKHIVILTDGQTAGDPQEGLRIVEQLSRKGISVSTVSIGDSTNDPLLEQMAKLGGGRCYPVNSKNASVTLPQIFIREATVLNRSLLAEGTFTPSISGQSPPGVSTTNPVAPVAGYVITAGRGGLAQNAIVVASNGGTDPLFAWWNYGVGRSAAFTSDFSSRWGSAWIQWSGFQPWCAGLSRWLLRQSAPMDTSLTTQSDGDQTVVELVTSDDDVNMASAVATAKVLRPDGTLMPLALRQKAPHRWSATFTTEASGAYLVNAALMRNSTDRPVFIQSAVNVSYPREFRFAREDQTKLQQIADIAAGRMVKIGDTTVNFFESSGTLPAESLRQIWDFLLYAATLLFIVDVAARRLVFEKRVKRSQAAVVGGQVAQAWKVAKQRASESVAQTGASIVSAHSSSAATQAEVDQPTPAIIMDQVNNERVQISDDKPKQNETPLDQMTPLERLREAKRRANKSGEQS